MTLYNEVESLSSAYEKMETLATKKVYNLKGLENQALEAMTVVSIEYCFSWQRTRVLIQSTSTIAESQSRTQVFCRMSEIRCVVRPATGYRQDA